MAKLAWMSANGGWPSINPKFIGKIKKQSEPYLRGPIVAAYTNTLKKI